MGARGRQRELGLWLTRFLPVVGVVLTRCANMHVAYGIRSLVPEPSHDVLAFRTSALFPFPTILPDRHPFLECQEKRDATSFGMSPLFLKRISSRNFVLPSLKDDAGFFGIGLAPCFASGEILLLMRLIIRSVISRMGFIPRELIRAFLFLCLCHQLPYSTGGSHR